MGAPFFPYDGAAFLIETEADRQHIDSFVKNDPYVKNKIVSEYRVKEFDIASVEMKRRFDSMTRDFSFRS